MALLVREHGGDDPASGECAGRDALHRVLTWPRLPAAAERQWHPVRWLTGGNRGSVLRRSSQGRGGTRPYRAQQHRRLLRIGQSPIKALVRLGRGLDTEAVGGQLAVRDEHVAWLG
jgi:hypothetical protein